MKKVFHSLYMNFFINTDEIKYFETIIFHHSMQWGFTIAKK